MTRTNTQADMRRRDLPASLQGRQLLQVRMDGEAPKTLAGYGAVFYREGEPGTEYWLWDDLVERIMPGTFDRALQEDDVRSFFNHDPDTILGRRSFSERDTLRLSVDDIGLRYEVDYDPEDSDHQRIFPKIASGKVSGSSFMFVPLAETYRSETVDGKRLDIIEVQEVQLWEVGPVVFPAYEGTTSEARRRMLGNLTTRERADRDRRAQDINAERLQRFRHRAAVQHQLRHFNH